MNAATASLAAVVMPAGRAERERNASPAVATGERTDVTVVPAAGAAPAPSRWARLRRAVAARRPQTASLLLQGIAAGALYLSYEGMHQLALAAGYPRVQALIWPLIVDGFVVHASRDVLRAWRANHKGRAAADGFLIVLAAGASAAFQATAAAGTTAAAKTTVAAPAVKAAVAAPPAAPLVLVVTAHVVPPVAALLALALEVFAKYDHQQQRADGTAKRRTSGRRGDADDATAGARSKGAPVARHATAAGKARDPRGNGASADLARLAGQVEDAFLEREVRNGERLVAARLAVELDGDDRRKRRVQDMLRRLRTEPTSQQRARIDTARGTASTSATSGEPEARPAGPRVVDAS